MAGKKKSPPQSPRSSLPTEVSAIIGFVCIQAESRCHASLHISQVRSKVAELKAVADKHFLGKDFAKAVESYEEAIKTLGDAPEKNEFLQKTANCYLLSKK